MVSTPDFGKLPLYACTPDESIQQLPFIREIRRPLLKHCQVTESLAKALFVILLEEGQ